VRHGKWYREQNDDVFEGRTWTAVTSGVLKGKSQYFNNAPILKVKKIKKEWDLMEDKRLYIEEKTFQNLPEFFRYYRNFPRSLDFIILDSFGKQTYKRRVELYEKVEDGFLKIKFPDRCLGDYCIPMRYLREGSRLLIRVNDYYKKISRKKGEMVNEGYKFVFEGRIEVEGAYFEYNLSGSSKALAE